MANREDRVCDLSCKPEFKVVDHSPLVHEYTGQARIKIVDPDPKTYRKKVIGTACISVSQLLIGASVIVVCFFILSLQMPLTVNAHILLCTFGYQLFMPIAILIPDGRETSSAPLNSGDRKCEHYLLSSLGLVCGIAGTFIAEFSYYDPKFPEGRFFICNLTGTSYRLNHQFQNTTKVVDNSTSTNKPPSDRFLKKPRTTHSLTAWITFGFALATILSGVLAIVYDLTTPCGKVYTSIHSLSGLACFVTSSVCFVHGLEDINFIAWLDCIRVTETYYILLVFCGFYTFIVIIIPLAKIIKGYAPGFPI